jgi:eukaryotic-like serine/threonine-protein kinase
MLGKTALGKYRLVRSLGRGSNAEVFLAEPTSGTGPWVVVKRIHDHIVAHPKFAQLFEGEVRSMGKFSHPYAVQFLEASLDDPLGPCLVMEYVPGITLEALIVKQRRLDVDRTGRLLGYFCHALQAAHAAGVIHRDLKPANLMVRRAGAADESVKVMDFGFAGFATKPHLQLAELTGRGTVQAIGTPGYVSPEMIRGDRVDTRSDLYAVGVILYEMLSGRLPFEYYSQDKLIAAHLNNTPPPFAKFGVGDVPPGVEAVVQLAMSKYPNERQQTAREITEMYGRAIGIDLWAQTAPEGWTPPAAAPEPPPPAPDTDPDLSADPLRITHQFQTSIPERLAAAKIRGFVEDVGGEVLASEPGLIRLRIGLPHRQHEKATGSSIFQWFRSMAAPKQVIPRGQEPIELELHLQKPDPARPQLHLTVAFHPMKEFPPANVRLWRERCDKLSDTLRQYFGA